MKWITRSNIKVDRVACPWLIRRFVDPKAEFMFVAEDALLTASKKENAIPFDAPRLPEVKLNYGNERCAFEPIIEDYQLHEPGLSHLALIVRAADIKGQEHVAPEGFALLGLADADRLARQFPVYDALYEHSRRQET
jgi:hypothetical protein